jgi:hypothetical protein
LNISEILFEKIRKLYSGKPEFQNFCVFELIFNYNYIGGTGHQWALPGKVIEILKEVKFGTELFASPFNV